MNTGITENHLQVCSLDFSSYSCAVKLNEITMEHFKTEFIAKFWVASTTVRSCGIWYNDQESFISKLTGPTYLFATNVADD